MRLSSQSAPAQRVHGYQLLTKYSGPEWVGDVGAAELSSRSLQPLIDLTEELLLPHSRPNNAGTVSA